jgi:hypothetical protein
VGHKYCKASYAKILFNDLDADPKRNGYGARWKDTDQPIPFENKMKYQYMMYHQTKKEH